MSKVTKWIEDMRGVAADFGYRRDCVVKYCEYGLENFCDGRVNKTYKNGKPRGVCPYFVEGKCTKEKVRAENY